MFTNQKVAVYAQDRKTILGYVAIQATSVGASKVANSRTAELARVNGSLSWIAKE
tara:strand:- start:306 stop:470 length:165 start_codon:yes stop_codon:yes gene_type:complete